MSLEVPTGDFLQPLQFVLEKRDDVSDDKTYSIDCLICSHCFDNGNEFCQHMVLEHNVVIVDSVRIAHLKSYSTYWKKRFRDVSYTEICIPIVIGGQDGDNTSKEQLYLLSDAIAEDQLLREKLKRKRLEAVLEQHEQERKDKNFEGLCLFCKKTFVGNRMCLFLHMADDHNLIVGQPDNIVFAKEFLDLLHEKMNKNLQCLFCEAVFKDHPTLKEHMRKKFHKKINPKNTEYDKFYLINYLELDKNWEVLHAEDDSEIQETGDEKEELWGDWHDKECGCVCLFCEFGSPVADEVLRHMDSDHGFNLKKILKVQKMTYYKQVKLVNYIRRQVYQLSCFSCLRTFPHHGELLSHMTATKHASFVPDALMWDHPQYYFPTYENDNLLCALGDDESDCGDDLKFSRQDECVERSGDSLVVAEDVNIPLNSILWNESVRRQL